MIGEQNDTQEIEDQDRAFSWSADELPKLLCFDTS
jgi:hypothetical protein